MQKKLGKWHTLGYSENRQHYLHYHEALYLIDMNRLELKWNSVIMSVEQAYTLLLNTSHPKSSGIGIDEYVVYSQLQRCGFNVQLHNNTSNASPSGNNDCVWKCLAKMLQPKNCDNDESAQSSVAETLNTMNQFAERIKLQIPAESDGDDVSENELSDWSMKAVPIKRKADHSIENPKKKKLKHDTREYKPHRYLNILLNDVEEKFENIFDHLDVIKIMSWNDDDNECETLVPIKFVFDIYDANAVYKKSELCDGPKYRVVVVR